jgi:hypothetical protein
VGELIINIYRPWDLAIPPTPPEHEGMDGDVIMALYLHITLESRIVIDQMYNNRLLHEEIYHPLVSLGNWVCWPPLKALVIEKQ